MNNEIKLYFFKNYEFILMKYMRIKGYIYLDVSININCLVFCENKFLKKIHFYDFKYYLSFNRWKIIHFTILF
jgi:hypothetical protein